jgi:hypothetical protein
MLLQVRKELAKRGVAIAVVASSEVYDGLRRHGLGTEGGGRGMFPTVDAAMAALTEPMNSA